MFRSDRLLQLGRRDEARVAFDQAVALASSAADAGHVRRHLDRLLRESEAASEEIVAAGVGLGSAPAS